MLEEVGEADYRTDRAMFHITGQPSIRRVAGIRLGRVSDITPNDPDFGLSLGADRALLVRPVGHPVSGPRRHRA